MLKFALELELEMQNVGIVYSPVKFYTSRFAGWNVSHRFDVKSGIWEKNETKKNQTLTQRSSVWDGKKWK